MEVRQHQQEERETTNDVVEVATTEVVDRGRAEESKAVLSNDGEELVVVDKRSADIHKAIMTELISFGVDIMARNYNPQGDTTLHNAMVRSKQLENNVKNATGSSVAKSRFTTTYWRAWNTELVDLEDLCRKENATAASVVAQQEAAAACQATKEKATKKKNLASFFQKNRAKKIRDPFLKDHM
jgi:hypothetical protein